MDLAIVHDYLSQFGGAERTVLRLAAMFPEAPVFTSFYAPERTYPEFRSLDVRTTALQARVDPDHFRRSALRYPSAFAGLDLSGFDRVLVSSSGFAHHVRHPRSYVYCYTPPRFLYAPTEYFGSAVRARLAAPVLAGMRVLDRRAARRHRSYAAISRVAAERIRLRYGRTSRIIYPPLGTSHLPARPAPLPASPSALVIARLLPYKRVDVAIDACAKLGLPLRIVGTGPDERRLRARASRLVSFLGTLGEDDMASAFDESSIVLVPGVDDFGYLPVEAAYAGRPTVAIGAGGALETVVPGVTGEHVSDDNVERWATTIASVLARSWRPDELRAATKPFGAEMFGSAIRRWLEEE